jgi:hypothetical protein
MGAKVIVSDSEINGPLYNHSCCNRVGECGNFTSQSMIFGPNVTFTDKVSVDAMTCTSPVIVYSKDNSSTYLVKVYGQKIAKCPTWTDSNQTDIVHYNATKIGTYYQCSVLKNNHTGTNMITHFYSSSTYNSSTLVDGFQWTWK